MSVPEALEEAGLAGWALEKRPLYSLRPDLPDANGIIVPGGFEVAPDIFEHMRGKDNKRLGYVGGIYQSLHNEELASVFDLLVSSEGLNVAKMQTAGSLLDGRRVWMLMSLVDSGFTVGNQKHPIIPFLLGMNSHDGTGSGKFLLTTVDVVCNNTLNAALGEAYAELSVNIRHTGNMQEKLQELRKMMAQAASVFGDFKVKADALDDVKVARDAYDEFMNTIFPEVDITKQGKRAIQNRNERVLAFTEALKEEVLLLPQYTATGGGEKSFSYWQLLSAVTRFTTHGDKIRVAKGRDEGEARFEKQLLGAGAEFNAQATNKILELSGVGGSKAA
jgi:phage/plasmid-like protein (TIGR03299 family)